MKDRSLLILLAVVAAFVLYVKPARENLELLRTRITVLDSQIAAQEGIKRQRKSIAGTVKTTGAAASANESYLYPPGKSNSLALVDLQDLVKETATANHMEVVNSTWGEPMPDKDTGLTRIPMAFTVRGMPADLDTFLKKLMYGRRFIKTERASISRYQNQQLNLEISLVAFKRDGKRD